MPTPYTGDLSYIFVIHADGDVAAAPILDALARRYRVCYATPDAPAEAIKAQIEGSVGVLFVATAHSINAGVCRERLARALLSAKPTTLLCVDDSPLPRALALNRKLHICRLADGNPAVLPATLDGLPDAVDLSAALLSPTDDEEEILGDPVYTEAPSPMASADATADSTICTAEPPATVGAAEEPTALPEPRPTDYEYAPQANGWAIKKYTGTNTYIVLPQTYQGKPVLAIAQDAFLRQTTLTNVVIPVGITSIDGSAFAGCVALTSVTIPDGVTDIEDGAFRDCGALASVAIPNSVTSIGKCAFAGCSGLSTMTLGDGVVYIGHQAFYGCSALTAVTIPRNVAYIEKEAFVCCLDLATLVVAEGNPVYHSDGNCIIHTATNTVVVGCKNSVIPTGVTVIGDAAFRYCSTLTDVTLPVGVTSIGDNAFAGCSGLVHISIPHGVTTIGWGAFSQCGALLAMTIPDGVTTIPSEAFAYCKHLFDVTIPRSVIAIKNESFIGCSRLANITFDGTMAQWRAIRKDAWHDYSLRTVRCTDGTINMQ